MTLSRFAAAGALAAAVLFSASAQAAPRNVIIFVADGLRSHSVTPETAPALAAVRSEGVDFANSHSLYPTVTTPNSSAIATGHLLGDTGDFGNTLFVGEPLPAPYGSSLAGIEDDDLQLLLNQRFAGNYLGETTLLAAARAKGYSVAALGKHGPTAIQDVTSRDGKGVIELDDDTGGRDGGHGIPLDPQITAAMKAAGLDTLPPDRGLNGGGGSFNMAGVLVANVEQQNWFAGVATQVLLPKFKAEGKPFILLFWSRDPDGTQHGQGDSLNALEPGINGPTSKAAIRNASNDLQKLRDALKTLGLDANTDIVVTADHGFSTMSREAHSSPASKFAYRDVQPGFLPQGFLDIDMSIELKLKLHDSAGSEVVPKDGFYPRRGSLLGPDPAHPQIIIAPNGGTDLIYLPGPDAKARAAQVVEFLTRQEYVGAIFVNDALGSIPGALPMSRIGLIGSARTPQPSIVLSFKSWSTGCADPEMCGVEFADSGQQQGQGIHGSFGRQDTHNFMAAIGPDFKAGFVDPAPVSNADWANTLAHILGLQLSDNGRLRGRVMAEALADGGAPPEARAVTVRSEPAANGFVTVLNAQETAGETYFDAAGMPGRTLGLKP
ncbi:alkaline phosphatase family protein [Phenylobacterium sp.]|jgi:arylsulfatase A-like enzyme|uniref:alkaline phosphatase family protein n=1 Tax=Phenylobacterium sp. TaxID=1871053 RepID=UPI002E34C5E2|nr:alkaline phosphatase family protein [Phenylobacterium sp.]HEX3364706.1 alkaline phosphatase family protein [Phenylobacterium sp.]